MKKPPCKTPDGMDCPRRYIGCQAECDAYHEWLAKHEAEKELIRKNREKEWAVDGFLALQNKRAYQARQRESKKRSR